MEQVTTVSVSQGQILLALAFQIWIIVFPILIIRKLNHFTQLLHAALEGDEDDAQPPASS